MKYFRPELYLQSQPRYDDATIEAAMTAWDQAQIAYDAELKQDWARFPKVIRHYLDTIRLHDGLLVVHGPPDADQLHLVVRTDTPSGEFVEFTYFLTDPPGIVDAGFPSDLRSDAPYWLYDEFEVSPIMVFPTTPSFTHSILLSTGWEIRVRFHDVEIRQYAPLFAGAAVQAV